MGIDIHMSIVTSAGEIIAKEIADFRDAEWFDNITGCGYKEEYDTFPAEPTSYLNIFFKNLISDDYINHQSEYCLTDFRYIKVFDFLRWYATKLPNIDAGWVTEYEQWAYNNKDIIPEIRHEKPKMDEELYFIELEDSKEHSFWLYKYIHDHEIKDDDYIVYYFDC